MVQSRHLGMGRVFPPGWRNGLTHTVDPYWSLSGRLRAEEKYLAAPAGGSKIESENLPKKRSTQNRKTGIQSGLGCGASVETAE